MKQNKRPSEKFWRGLWRTLLVLPIMTLILGCVLYENVLVGTLFIIGFVLVGSLIAYLIVAYEDYSKFYPRKLDTCWLNVNYKYNIFWIISKFLDRNYGKE